MLLRATGLPSRRLGQHPVSHLLSPGRLQVVRSWFSSALTPSHVSWFDHGPRIHSVGLIPRNDNLELYRVDGGRSTTIRASVASRDPDNDNGPGPDRSRSSPINWPRVFSFAFPLLLFLNSMSYRQGRMGLRWLSTLFGRDNSKDQEVSVPRGCLIADRTTALTLSKHSQGLSGYQPNIHGRGETHPCRCCKNSIDTATSRPAEIICEAVWL
ncbi:hypothetical protein P168DRAFT_186267 [Aspergillus campestris IBT 28561]|uniref:Uncharacterized protein n=1 Tax=Aspergillus campestris (strain IBT 28561) TaxID=1392248 RepID=A0A2I1CY63_ASPC2|nr:uncharacterized protein P168DRAFT_186267 [Aspergillus campestris IBT 28561]PKY02558.1 hypothetical protein P168DRAFT_186267 [Aspergillus campestris IBT 28561]